MALGSLEWRRRLVLMCWEYFFQMLPLKCRPKRRLPSSDSRWMTQHSSSLRRLRSVIVGRPWQRLSGSPFRRLYRGS